MVFVFSTTWDEIEVSSLEYGVEKCFLSLHTLGNPRGTGKMLGAGFLKSHFDPSEHSRQDSTVWINLRFTPAQRWTATALSQGHFHTCEASTDDRVRHCSVQTVIILLSYLATEYQAWVEIPPCAGWPPQRFLGHIHRRYSVSITRTVSTWHMLKVSQGAVIQYK